MSMQWQPSTFSPGSHLGDLSDSDTPPLFPHSVNTETDSMSYPMTPQLVDFGLARPPFIPDNDCHEAMTLSSPTKNDL